MPMLLAIAVGGAAGALSRHFVAGAIMRALGTGFPYGTFAVNILGSLFMGFLITAFAHKLDITQELRGFLAVGFLGSFTTFSTYSLETVLLIERGDWTGAGLYALGSLLLGVMGLFAGIWLGRVLV
ncbi:fluoride efflux transporter CrcB [Kordiimonas lacus]|uniref:Fluoride-specific ion channel FluC n=1 Tax=Kordiimonas lacus TaxID=637679 RepID=A0A1G7BZY6_9PROT|nr:fluoride efflux transporter CrcB [Kordiimonas lacus]SDE32632.1 camphor resistance protein CrcB [Kordiimonas lacus]